ncbi:MAG: DUF3307 domain-containing protein, partial [Maritimibacter sp.]
VTAGAALGQYARWEVLALALAHILIDIIKAQFAPDTARTYLADQGAHLLTLIATATLAPNLWSTGLWASAPAILPSALLLIAGGLYATRAGGFAVGKLMAPYAAGAPEYSLPGGGMMIGQLERGLIYLMFLVGQPAGIGFLIAAKSVLRFDAASKNEKAEYVIIGTLASFGWAIAVSFVVLGLLHAMNGQPFLEIIAPKP